MKNMNKQKHIKLLSIFLLFVFLFITADVSASNYTGDKLVVGSEYELGQGESLKGNIVILGSEAKLEKGSTVDGNIVLFSGELEINGTVNGDIAAFSGAVELKSNAVVNGNFTSFGSDVKRDKNAFISGDSVRQNSEKIQRIEEIGRDVVPEEPAQTGFFASIFIWMTKLLVFMGRLLIFAGIAVIANLLFENHLRAASQSIVKRPLEALGIGLLTIVALPFILLFFMITVVLIPAALLLIILFVVICLYAWIAAGYELGRLLAQALKVNWASNWTTAIGTFALSLVFFGLSSLIPCVGWIPGAIVLAIGIGAVIIYHGKLFQNDSKSNRHALLKETNATNQSIPQEVKLRTSSTPTSAPAEKPAPDSNPPAPAGPEAGRAEISGSAPTANTEEKTGEKPVVPEVIELGPGAISDKPEAGIQPDAEEGQEEGQEIETPPAETQDPVTNTSPDDADSQPTAETPAQETPDPRKPKTTSRKRNPRKKGFGSSILDSLHDDITDDPDQEN